jgi:hypothetical protein
VGEEIGWQVTGPDFHHRPDEAAHHLPQEMRRHEAQQDEIAVLGHLGALDGHDRAGMRFRLLAEAGEIVPADQRRPGRPQVLHVEWTLDPPDERLGEGGAAPRELVDVAAEHRVVARVEPLRRQFEAQDFDVGRQQVVDLAPDLARIDRAREPEVGHLRQRVHSRVRAPRRTEIEHRAGDAGERTPQLATDGPSVLLFLPAAVARPFVLDDQAVGRHACIMHAARATISGP